ncbi:MAG: zinc ribbon domain-containing protein, partial [Acidobacteria bacterium 21-70-11]
TSPGKFCSECGAPLKPKTECPTCGAKVGPGAKFCPECGGKLA